MRCKYRVFLFCLFFVFTFNNLNHHIQQLVCVYVCVLFSPVYHFFLFPSAGGFTLYNSPSVFRFFSSTKISTEKSFKFTQKKLPFQHSLTLGLLLCCLSLYFAINIVGLLAPIASGIQLVFSPPFQADTQSGKNSRPKSTSFSFFKVLTILFLIFAAIRTGKSCSKWSLQSVYPKKANSKARTTCCCLSGFINLKIGLLEDVCVCLYQRCMD